MGFCFLSQVLQDPIAKREELRARAKGLKTLGKIFQVNIFFLFFLENITHICSNIFI